MTTEAYLRERFATVAVVTEPFPHFALTSILPPEIYAKMEAAIPPGWRWQLSACVEDIKRRTKGTQPHFGVRQPDQGACFGLSPYRDHWLARFGDIIEMIDVLTIEAFAPHIERYRERLAGSGIAVSKQVSPGQALFCQRSDNWTIEPHTHNLPQIVQSMIYFPLPGSHEDQGTVLYRLKERKTVPAVEFAATRPFAIETVEPAVVLPYRENCLVSFMNTPEAVHSTNPVDGPSRRYIFSCMQASVEIGSGNITIGDCPWTSPSSCSPPL
jgi:hypothetical protein